MNNSNIDTAKHKRFNNKENIIVINIETKQLDFQSESTQSIMIGCMILFTPLI